MTGELQGDFHGKIAALEPSFRFLAERTGREPTAGMIGLYAEYFVQQGLMMEAVNQTVRDIVISWDDYRWPSAEYIAVRARQKQRSVMDHLHGITPIQQALEDICEAEAQRRWDRRLAEANAWRERRPERFKVLVRAIDTDIAGLIRGGNQWLNESQVYRRSFREGAAVGACLKESGIEERREQKRLEKERAARAVQEAQHAELQGAA